MAFRIDTSRALRTHDQLVELVRAVHRADKDDENRAIEWKASYPSLTALGAAFAISRAILGLANRPVDVARTAFEGVGYVLIGVSPGQLQGQSVPDSAELLNSLKRFTGNSHPLWDARSVDIDGVNVLIFLVEPPRNGDRIALLHRSYQPEQGRMIPEGTIFVRQPGATERATRLDLEMLQDRLIAGHIVASAATEEERRVRARELVAAAVQQAGQWTNAIEIITVMSRNRTWSQQDLMGWLNSPSGHEMADARQIIDDCFRKLRLSSSDTTLLAALASAEAAMANEIMFAAVRKREQFNARMADEAQSAIDATRERFRQIEQIAVTLYAS